MSQNSLYSRNSSTLIRKSQLAAFEYAKFRRIIDDIGDRAKIQLNNDTKDSSIHPSYTQFRVPYNMVCLNRYSRSKELFERQFQREIKQILQQHSAAVEAARFSRHMCITTLWPPFHNKREIEDTHRHMFHLNRKQRSRLEYLMNNKIA